MSAPFARAKMMFAAIAAALSLVGNAQRDALGKIVPYRSRGKGGKHITKNRIIGGAWSQDRSKYNPKECFRRGNR